MPLATTKDISKNFEVKKDEHRFVVTKKSNGAVFGRHAEQADAEKQAKDLDGIIEAEEKAEKAAKAPADKSA